MLARALIPIVAAMDCVSFLKYYIPDYEFGPGLFAFGLSNPLGVFLLLGLALKFSCSQRFVVRLLSRKQFPDFESRDVSKLRESVELERRRSSELSAELARERDASASAAEETMAMILRLQTEKSSIEMELRQYKRMAEERQAHDHRVIRSLQRLVLRPCDDDGNFLEEFESVLYSSRDAEEDLFVVDPMELCEL